MQERLEALKDNISLYSSAVQYYFIKFLTGQSRDIINLSDINSVLPLIDTLPWQKLLLLRCRIAELALINERKNELAVAEEWLDLCSVTEDTLMLRIREDVNAPEKFKKMAENYIRLHREIVLIQALEKPQK